MTITKFLRTRAARFAWEGRTRLASDVLGILNALPTDPVLARIVVVDRLRCLACTRDDAFTSDYLRSLAGGLESEGETVTSVPQATSTPRPGRAAFLDS